MRAYRQVLTALIFLAIGVAADAHHRPCHQQVPCVGTVQLAWDASVSPGVTGYEVHYGLAPGNYSTTVDAGLALSAAIAGLTIGQTYYFSATAYDGADNSSGYSNEVSKRVQ